MENQFSKRYLVNDQDLIEGALQNYNLDIYELNKYLYRIYDKTGTKYGEEYLHDIDFESSKLRIIQAEHSFISKDYDPDRLNVFIDENNIIIRAFKG